jgi:hypothetical protein
MINKDAIYDAVAVKLPGLEGIWEDQKDAVKPDGAHFSLRMLSPGIMWERKGNVMYRDGERAVRVTRLMATLQVSVYDSDYTPMLTAQNSTIFHKTLNDGGIVCHGLIGSFDTSRVFTEWEDVHAFDFQISWTETANAFDDEPTDEFVETVEITGDIDGYETEIVVPNREIRFTSPAASTGQTFDVEFLTRNIDLITELKIVNDALEEEIIGTDILPGGTYPHTTAFTGACTLVATAYGYDFIKSITVTI